MKEIYLLKKTFFSEEFVKKIFNFTKMTILLLMVVTFNVTGAFALDSGKSNTEGNNTAINLSIDNLGDRDNTADMQQLRITGTITDENGSPFPGVNILVEGTTTGTNSDVN